MSDIKRDMNITQLKNMFFYTFGIVPLDYYNVIGDGITDNRRQLQQAIYDAIQNNIKYIFVTKGEYYYSMELDKKEEIIFLGNSVDTYIRGIEIRQFPELWNESQGIANSINPIGSILLWAGNNIPNGYLECNGQVVNVINYSVLHTILKGELEEDTFSIPSLSSGNENTKYIIRAR